MNFSLNQSYGLVYRLRTLDENGNVDQSTDWSHNLVLNNAGDILINGGGDQLIRSVELGSNNAAVVATQTGLLTPFGPDVVRQIAYVNTADRVYKQISPTQATVTWSYTLTFQNISENPVTPKEIGIQNLSRAIIIGLTGAINATQIAPNGSFLVDVDIIQNISVLATVTASVKDLSGTTLYTRTANLTVTEPVLAVQEGSWYDFFSYREDVAGFIGVLLADGSVRWSDTSYIDVTVSGTGRVISYAMKIRGLSEGMMMKGLIVRFGNQAHQLNVNFDVNFEVKPTENYLFTFKLNW